MEKETPMEHAISEEEIDRLSALCRIACTEEEKQSLRQSLTKVLTYVDMLSQVDVTNTPPCNTVLDDLCNVTREDIVQELLPRDLFLKESPAHTGGMIRVPPILPSEEAE